MARGDTTEFLLSDTLCVGLWPLQTLRELLELTCGCGKEEKPGICQISNLIAVCIKYAENDLDEIAKALDGSIGRIKIIREDDGCTICGKPMKAVMVNG